MKEIFFFTAAQVIKATRMGILQGSAEQGEAEAGARALVVKCSISCVNDPL